MITIIYQKTMLQTLTQASDGTPLVEDLLGAHKVYKPTVIKQ